MGLSHIFWMLNTSSKAIGPNETFLPIHEKISIASASDNSFCFISCALSTTASTTSKSGGSENRKLDPLLNYHHIK